MYTEIEEAYWTGRQQGQDEGYSQGHADAVGAIDLEPLAEADDLMDETSEALNQIAAPTAETRAQIAQAVAWIASAQNHIETIKQQIEAL